MNQAQELWLKQVISDHNVLTLLRRNSADPCQHLHYLQMVTEKLAKAYLWRGGRPPTPSHKAFINFLRAILSRSSTDRERIAHLFGYQKIHELENVVRQFSPLAYDLERLAPALAGPTGPNPEYPWPVDWPLHAPASHRFTLWDDLTNTVPGRQLMRFIDKAVESFSAYA